MEYVKLGRTELQVSRICFGTWQFGGDWGRMDLEQSKGAVRRALEFGINFFDTAQGYGFGDAERLLGEALKPEMQARRHEVVIATKGGLRMAEDGLVRDSSPQFLRQGVEESLGYLGTEYIDLYQVHWPDHDTPFAETAGALEELVREGKIRHVGVSNFSTEEMAEFEQSRPVETLQPPYHLFRRDIESDVLPWCAEHNVGVLGYGPMAHGLLSGKFDRSTTLDEDDWRSGSELFSGENFERNLEAVESLTRFAEGRDLTVAQIAVAWAIANPAVHVAIVGARDESQIEGTAPAGDVRLADADLKEIDRIMEGAVAVGGPTPEG
jgi:aryl-alcohol dehydrogenase-like predicted oxidoreductase